VHLCDYLVGERLTSVKLRKRRLDKDISVFIEDMCGTRENLKLKPLDVDLEEERKTELCGGDNAIESGYFYVY
jgi:hypothetical protein